VYVRSHRQRLQKTNPEKGEERGKGGGEIDIAFIPYLPWLLANDHIRKGKKKKEKKRKGRVACNRMFQQAFVLPVSPEIAKLRVPWEEEKR